MNNDDEDKKIDDDNDDGGNLSSRTDQDTDDSNSWDTLSSTSSGVIMTRARAQRMRTGDGGTPRQVLSTPTLNRELR